MNRQQKERVVQSLREQFSQSPASFLVEYKGLTVNQLQDLRTKLRAQGGTFKVAKNRLMRIAVEDLAGNQPLVPYFKEQIGVVFASDQPPAVAKVLHEFSKIHAALALVMGQLDAKLLSPDAIKMIATLPSREVLLAQVCGSLKAPITNMHMVLKIQLIQLVVVLKKIADNKQ
jgi:Ribosomal protein L10